MGRHRKARLVYESVLWEGAEGQGPQGVQHWPRGAYRIFLATDECISSGVLRKRMVFFMRLYSGNCLRRLFFFVCTITSNTHDRKNTRKTCLRLTGKLCFKGGGVACRQRRAVSKTKTINKKQKAVCTQSRWSYEKETQPEHTAAPAPALAGKIRRIAPL